MTNKKADISENLQLVKIIELVHTIKYPHLVKPELEDLDNAFTQELLELIAKDNKISKYIYNNLINGIPISAKQQQVLDKVINYFEDLEQKGLGLITVGSILIEEDTTQGILSTLPINSVYLDKAEENKVVLYIDTESFVLTVYLGVMGDVAGILEKIDVDGDIDPNILKYMKLFALRLSAEIIDSLYPGENITIKDEEGWQDVVDLFKTLPQVNDWSLIKFLLLNNKLLSDKDPFWTPILTIESSPDDITNNEISKFLTVWRDLEAIEGEGAPNIQFRLSAYLNAATAIRNADFPLVGSVDGIELDVLEPLKPQLEEAGKKVLKWVKEYGMRGVGQSMANKIAWLLLIGTHPRYDELLTRYAPLVELMRVEGIGAATAKRLFNVYGIKTLDQLWEAINKDALEGGISLPAKSTEWLVRYKAGATGDRLPYSLADKRYKEFEQAFNKEFAGLKTAKISPAGSYRRKRETIKDIDVVVLGVSAADISTMCNKYGWKVLAAGEDKVEPLVEDIKADVIIVKSPEEWGAALTYLTGSKQFNIMMRDDAKRHGWILNQRGLFAGRTEEAPRVTGSETEEGVFTALNWPWIPPEDREAGKFEAKVKQYLLFQQLGKI